LDRWRRAKRLTKPLAFLEPSLKAETGLENELTNHREKISQLPTGVGVGAGVSAGVSAEASASANTAITAITAITATAIATETTTASLDPHAAALPASSRPSIDRSKPLLDARQVSKAFAGVQALEGVNLKVYPGEILGLLGPNGSGKSTFINLVSGHFPASSGQILFEGRDLTQLKPHDIANLGVARTYQIPRPFAHMTVLQNVALVAMFGLASPTQAQATQAAWTWLEFTGLADKAHDLPDALNLHQRKFLELARALAARPKLVLLDEVLSGLTPSEINDAIALILKIRAQGSTIVFVEHVMHAVMALVDRIAVLDQGKLLAEGEPQAVMRNPAVVKAYLGSAQIADEAPHEAKLSPSQPGAAHA
jgi:branched-chain amino acid transport system permease protein